MNQHTCRVCFLGLLHGEDDHGPARQSSFSGMSYLEDLKMMYHQLTPSSQLDITMVTEWGRTDIQELFDDDGSVEAQSDAGSVHYQASQQTPQRRRLGF